MALRGFGNFWVDTDDIRAVFGKEALREATVLLRGPSDVKVEINGKEYDNVLAWLREQRDEPEAPSLREQLEAALRECRQYSRQKREPERKYRIYGWPHDPGPPWKRVGDLHIGDVFRNSDSGVTYVVVAKGVTDVEGYAVGCRGHCRFRRDFLVTPVRATFENETVEVG